MSVSGTAPFRITFVGRELDAQALPGVRVHLNCDHQISFNDSGAALAAVSKHGDERIQGGWPELRLYFADSLTGDAYVAWGSGPKVKSLTNLENPAFPFSPPGEVGAGQAAMRQGLAISLNHSFQAEAERQGLL